MFNKIIDFIKERNKTLYTLILFLIVISLLHEVLLSHLLSVVIITVFVVGKNWLFRYSDKKTNEHNEEYERIFTIETKDDKHVKLILTESTEPLDGIYGKTLEIILKNISGSNIYYIKGFIWLYDKKVRIKKIPFEIQNLPSQYGELLYYNHLGSRNRYWNYFDIFIEKIQTENLTDSDFKIDGALLIRNYFTVLNLNRLYDYKLIGIRTKYNMVWLKDVFRKIISYIKFFYSRKKLYTYRRSFIFEFKDDMIQFTKLILIILIFLLFLSASYLLIIDVFELIMSAFNICKEHIQM